MARLGMGLGFGTQSSQFAPIFGSESRNFTTLTASGVQYLTADSVVTLSGNFDIEFDIDLTTLTGNYTIMSDNLATPNSYLRIDATNGSIDALIEGSFHPKDGEFTADSKLNRFKISRVGNLLTRSLNGSSIGNSTGVGTGDFVISVLGRRGDGSNPYGGVMANVKITDAGTPIHLWKLDEVDPSAAVDSIGSNDLTGTNLSTADSENFTFDGSVSPNTWTNDGATRVIEVGGT